MKKPKLTRVQFDLPENSFLRLQELRETTEAASYAEVVKNALRLYEALIKEAAAGNTFQVRDESGTIRELLIF
jgi:Arc/MetJ-type ribon-helix-helix transcriptional regulator